VKAGAAYWNSNRYELDTSDAFPFRGKRIIYS